jgi:hypothetical protein
MWGGGWLASNGAKDFAGGIVLHATAGTSSLVACYMLGPRRGHQKEKESGGFPYSNIVTSTIGASILWVSHPPPSLHQFHLEFCSVHTRARLLFLSMILPNL